MILDITPRTLLPWRTTDESILYNLCYSRVYNNIIFNYDGCNMKNKEELKEYQRVYYLRNQQYWQEYARDHYHQHKEERKEYQLRNKERIREYDRAYALKNKEKKREYRLKNKELINKWRREYYKKNKHKIKVRRYYQDELRVGAEAEIDGGTASKAVTMALPNLENFKHCNGIRTKE